MLCVEWLYVFKIRSKSMLVVAIYLFESIFVHGFSVYIMLAYSVLWRFLTLICLLRFQYLTFFES